MQEKKEEIEEKLTDIKGTLESFVEGEKPEISQEDEIKAYKEGPQKPKKRKATSDDEDFDEDDEHLKRLKQELLASLEKVNKLARQLFGEKEANILKEIKLEEKRKSKEKEKKQEQSIESSVKSQGQERSREEWICY